MKAFNTLVVVALLLVFSKNTAKASPVGQSLRRATVVDSLAGGNLPSGSAFVARQSLTGITGILGPLLGSLGLGNLDVVSATSKGDTAGAPDGAGSVGDIGSAADNLPGKLTAL